MLPRAAQRCFSRRIKSDKSSEPLIASRSEGAIAHDVAIALGIQTPMGRTKDGNPGQEALF